MEGHTVTDDRPGKGLRRNDGTTRVSGSSGRAAKAPNLIFCCSPQNNPLDWAHQEAQTVNHLLTENSNVQFLGTSPEDLIRLLAECEPSAFFFIGHANVVLGRQHKTLLLAKDGKPAAIDAAVVADILCSCKSLDFVFLNGCDSLGLGQLLQHGGQEKDKRAIPYVICWRTSVVDEAASVFSRGVCMHLQKDPQDYPSAFEAGKTMLGAQVRSDGQLGSRWAMCDPAAGSAGEAECAGIPVLLTGDTPLAPPVSRELPAEPGEDRIAFEGRDELVARCLQFVDVNNNGLACLLICLWGPGGYGKTTAARHIMEDQSITKLYGGGVLRVNLRGTDPEHALNQHAVAVELLGQVSNEQPAPGQVLPSLQRLFDGTLARRCLVLFDDASDMDQIWHVAKELRGVLCVVTSRTKLKHNLPKSHPAIVEELDRFTQETVRRVFECHIASAEDDFLWSNEPSASDKELLLNELAAQCSGIPYEAGMVAARLCHALGGTQDYRSAVQHQIDSLAPEQRVRTLQEPQGEWCIGRALNPTLALLDPSQRVALDAMSMFPGSFTLDDLELLKIDGTPWENVKLLLKLCLLHRGDRDGDFVLHDLTRSFISSELTDPAQTQRTYCEGCILLSADLVSDSANDPASILRRAKDAARNLVHAAQLAQHLPDAGLCQLVLEAVWRLGGFPRTQWGCAGVLDSLVVLVDRQEQEPEIQHIENKGKVAGMLYTLGRFAESEPMRREVLEWHDANLGAEHIDTVTAKSNLAATLFNLKRFAESEPMQREVLQWHDANLGAEHRDAVTAKANLATTLNRLGRGVESESMERKVLEWRMEHVGAEHKDTVSAKANLAATLNSLGREAESEPMQHEVLEWRLANLGAEHLETVTAKDGLAATLHRLGRDAESEPMKREVLEWRMTNLGAEHEDTVTTKDSLAATLCSLGHLAESEAMEREVLEWRVANLGAEHKDTVKAKANLAAMMNRLGRCKRASR